MSAFHSEIVSNNFSLNAFSDRPDLQSKNPKSYSPTSRFLTKILRTSDICSLFDVPDASSAITE